MRYRAAVFFYELIAEELNELGTVNIALLHFLIKLLHTHAHGLGTELHCSGHGLGQLPFELVGLHSTGAHHFAQGIEYPTGFFRTEFEGLNTDGHVLKYLVGPVAFDTGATHTAEELGIPFGSFHKRQLQAVNGVVQKLIVGIEPLSSTTGGLHAYIHGFQFHVQICGLFAHIVQSPDAEKSCSRSCKGFKFTIEATGLLLGIAHATLKGAVYQIDDIV